MTIPTFTKLFTMSMVASKRLGLFRWASITLLILVSFDSMSLSCPGFSEKKAISEPEIIAEKKSNNKIIKMLIKTPIENSPVNKLPRM